MNWFAAPAHSEFDLSDRKSNFYFFVDMVQWLFGMQFLFLVIDVILLWCVYQRNAPPLLWAYEYSELAKLAYYIKSIDHLSVYSLSFISAPIFCTICYFMARHLQDRTLVVVLLVFVTITTYCFDHCLMELSLAVGRKRLEWPALFRLFLAVSFIAVACRLGWIGLKAVYPPLASLFESTTAQGRISSLAPITAEVIAVQANEKTKPVQEV